MSDEVKKTERKPGPRDGLAGPGRPKGVPNKITTAAKDAIAQAAEQLGGTNRIVEWAREDAKNEHAFWSSIYPKLIPLQVTGENGGPVQFVTLYEEMQKPSDPDA